jgi:hypothetical protein
MKTFVYGDSFSNAEWCKCTTDKMWYAPLVSGELVDRTREGASTEEMFLLAVNDAVTNSNARFILATGMMYSRLMLYKDRLYDNEQIRDGSLTDCLPYFDTQRLDKNLHVGIFHHTLVWAKYLTNIVTFKSLMDSRSHEWLAVHMHTDKKDYQSPLNPMILPLLKTTANMVNYVDQRHSCYSVCQQAEIKPWDYDQHGYNGHHSAEGQQYFSKHVLKVLQERNILI